MNRSYEQAEEYGVLEVAFGERYMKRRNFKNWYFAKFELQN
jgi:hypothetical protein